MSSSLQNYIASQFAYLSNVDLLGLRVYNAVGHQVVLTATESNLASNTSLIFLFSDIAAYGGIIAVIIALGSGYKKMDRVLLTKNLLMVSVASIYTSASLLLLGLYTGADLVGANSSLTLFENSYNFNFFTQISKLALLCTVAALYSFFNSVFITRMQSLELPLLAQIAIALSCTIISSSNFALLLLALEGFSLILYVMTALSRSYGGVTAAVKYFAFGTLGSIFLFWGVVHFYALVPSLSFLTINAILDHGFQESSSFNNAVEFATTAVAFGFMLKLGAAPVHQWVADVYAGSHLFITAFFSVFVKLTLFLVFFNIAVHFHSDSLLRLFIVVSLLTGCFMSLRQTEIKRLLAYSSIVHVGFILMGDSISAILYLLTYVVSSLLLFSILLDNTIAGKEITYLNDLRFIRGAGYFQISCLVTTLASSAGLPPFAGFYGKLSVWCSLMEDVYLYNDSYSYYLFFLSVSLSLLTIFYYMRVIAYLFVGADNSLYFTDTALYFVGIVKINSIIFVQTLTILFIVAWTLMQPWLLGILQHACITLN